MKRDRELMHELAHGSDLLHEITPEERSRLQLVLLGMYGDLLALCKRHGLSPMLIFGSAIGAVRHQGFIPWDDDLDVGMVREEYERLKELLEAGELGDKYEYTYPQRRVDSKNTFMKIYLRGSEFTEMTDTSSPFPKGIFIDVFPFDNAPGPGIRRWVKGKWMKLIRVWAVSVLYVTYPSEIHRRFSMADRSGKRRFRLRQLMGKAGGFMSHGKWAWLVDRSLCHVGKTGYLSGWGANNYAKNIFREEAIVPAAKAQFEGMEVLVPRDCHSYLTQIYGDYMRIPPEQDRETHYVVNLKLN